MQKVAQAKAQREKDRAQAAKEGRVLPPDPMSEEVELPDDDDDDDDDDDEDEEGGEGTKEEATPALVSLRRRSERTGATQAVGARFAFVDRGYLQAC